MPLRAAASAVTWAANGVDLREPLNPAEPADSQQTTLPSGSVIVTIVLLKEVLMWAIPYGTFFLTRRRARPLPFFGCGTSGTSLLRRRLLLAGDAHAPRALAGTRVGLRALPAGRQAAPVPQAAV